MELRTNSSTPHSMETNENVINDVTCNKNQTTATNTQFSNNTMSVDNATNPMLNNSTSARIKDPMPNIAISGNKNDPEPRNTENKDDQNDLSKFTIIKNLLVIGMAFLFLFTAFQSMSFLQSTLNKEDGLGTTGLAVIYVSLIVSCMFFPSFLVAHLGCKWTMALSMTCYIVYMAANMHAVGYLIYPASVLLGLGAAPLWSAKCTYLTDIAVRYAKMTGATEDAAINRFFGIFFMLFQTSGIWGNVISSSVLEREVGNISESDLAICGPNFCPQAQANNTNLDKPIDNKIYIMVGCYIACAVLGFITIALFLDKIILTKRESRDRGKLSARLLVETMRHCWNSFPQKLLIPLTIYSGVEQAFLVGDFTKSFIGCSVGMWNVGYVMICYGVVDSICSLTFGRLVQYLGHIFFFVLGAVIHSSLLITFLYWLPSPSTFHVLFVVAGLWGMADAVWQTQINALYGQLFISNSEAAFANYRLWESLGFAVTFAYSSYLCTDIKIYICMGVLGVGMVGYGAVEVVVRKGRRGKCTIEHPEIELGH